MYLLVKNDGQQPAAAERSVKDDPVDGLEDDHRDDDDGHRDDADGLHAADDDDDWSSDYDSDEEFNDILRSYMRDRDIFSTGLSDPNHTNKEVIEYLNLKYIENNFRSLGLIRRFDQSGVTEAMLEFELFEKLFDRKNKTVKDKRYFRELCLPMFCHLYLNLISPQNHEQLKNFLKKFKHIFENTKGLDFLKELKKVKDVKKLSPRLQVFRKNKYVFIVSPEFLNKLYNFLHHHCILKAVFQEWFDINYFTNENPMEILDKYCSKSMLKVNNEIHINVPKQSNIELNTNDAASNDKLNNKKQIPSQNKDSLSSISDFDNNVSNNETKQQKFKRKNKLSGSNKLTGVDRSSSSESLSKDTSSESSSCSDEEAAMRKYIKKQQKSSQNLSDEISCKLKRLHITKIDVNNLDEDLHSMRQITLINCNKLSCTILTSDNKYVAAGSLDSLIYLWERSNFSTELEINDLECNASKKTDSTILDQNNSHIEYLDRSTAKILRGHGGSIFDLAEIPSAKILLSASNDKTFRAWDLVTKQCLEVYDAYEHKTWCIAASPYGLQVATGSCDGACCLWFLNYKSPLRIFMGHLDDIMVIKFHPNQVLLATGSTDKTIRIFELVTGHCQRLLLGHSDYVTCLEFHAERPNLLASTSGSGEIIVWDIPTGQILWKLRVGKVLFSDLVWLNGDVLLASLTTGIVLKCDVTEIYDNETKKVRGCKTKFNRLMSLKIIDNIVYTIGIPDKSAMLKLSSTKLQTKTVIKTEKESQKEKKSSKDLSKVISSKHNNENNSNSVKPGFGLNSAAINNNVQYHMTTNPNDTINLSPEILQIDLQGSTLNLTSDEIIKLNSEYQSNNIKSKQKPKTTVQNTSPFPKKININNSNPTQIIVQTTSTNNSQQLTNVQQVSNNNLAMNVNFQHLKLANKQDPTIKTTNMDTQEQHQLELQEQIKTNVATNILVQQNQLLKNRKGNSIQISNMNIQQQQQQLPLIRPRLNTQSIQKGLLPQEQQHLLQQSIGNNIQINSANALQQLRSKTTVTKMNVQQRQPQQKIRLSNVNSQQISNSGSSLSSPSTPFRLAIRQQNTNNTTQSPSLDNMPAEDYARLRQAVMESLLQTNPEIFTRGQTVIGEIKRSQPTTKSFDDAKSNSQNEL